MCHCGEANCKGVIGVIKKGFEGIDEDEDEDYSSSQEDEVEQENHLSKKTFKLLHNAAPLEDPYLVSAISMEMLRSDCKNKILRPLRCLELTENLVVLRKFLHLHGLKILKNLLCEYTNQCDVLKMVRIFLYHLCS